MLTNSINNRLTLLTCIALAGMIALAHFVFRWGLWEAPVENIFVGFRTVLLFPFALLLLVSIVLTVWHCQISAAFRAGLFTTISEIMTRYGGLWWIALGIWIGLSLFWAAEPTLARYDLIHYSAELFAGLMLANLVRRGMARILLAGLFLGVCLQAVIAVAQVARQNDLGLQWLGEVEGSQNNLFSPGEEFFRGYGLTAHPNYLATYMILGIFGALAVLLGEASPRWLRMSAFATLFAGIGGLIVSFSRTELVIAIVTIGSIPLVLGLNRIHSGWKLVLPVLIAVIGAVLVFNQTFYWRFQDLRDVNALEDRLFYEFRNTNEVIKEKSLLQGAGAQNLMIEVGRNYETRFFDRELLPAHNTYWVIFAELGLVGVLLWLAALGSILIWLRPKYGREAFVWGMCLLTFCLLMLFEYHFWLDFRSRILIFWILGMWWGFLLQRQAHEVEISPEEWPEIWE